MYHCYINFQSPTTASKLKFELSTNGNELHPHSTFTISPGIHEITFSADVLSICHHGAQPLDEKSYCLDSLFYANCTESAIYFPLTGGANLEVAISKISSKSNEMTAADVELQNTRKQLFVLSEQIEMYKSVLPPHNTNLLDDAQSMVQTILKRIKGYNTNTGNNHQEGLLLYMEDLLSRLNKQELSSSIQSLPPSNVSVDLFITDEIDELSAKCSRYEDLVLQLKNKLVQEKAFRKAVVKENERLLAVASNLQENFESNAEELEDLRCLVSMLTTENARLADCSSFGSSSLDIVQ